MFMGHRNGVLITINLLNAFTLLGETLSDVYRQIVHCEFFFNVKNNRCHFRPNSLISNTF